MEQNQTHSTGTPSHEQPVYTSPVSPTPPMPPAPQKTIFPSDRRDSVLAAVLLALSVLYANFSLYGGFRLGYAIGFLAVLACGAVYLGQRLRRPTIYGAFCLTAAVATLGIFLWHADGAIRFYAVCGMTLLSALALLDATGIGRRDGGTIAVLPDVGRLLLSRPFAHLDKAIPAIFWVKKGDAIEKRRFGGAMLGLLCALPVLLVVVPLLLEADAAFEGLLEHTILDNLGEIFVSVLVGVLLFMLLFTLLFGLRHDLPEKPAAAHTPRQGVSAMGINAFLGTISAVYVLYLFSQLAYFLSAFSGILPEDYTVAQYARRGFFEMCAICAINLLLVAACLGLSRKEEGKTPLSTRLVALFVLLFSLGLVATALSKMVLYVGSFGMTRLRILTGVFMVMLGLVLMFVTVRLFRVRFPYMRAAVVAIAVIGLAVGYVDVDTFIARYNIHAYEQKQIEQLDVNHLTALSEGVVPHLVRLWENTQPGEDHHHTLTNYLREQLEEYGHIDWDTEADAYFFTPDPAEDFRKFNIDCLQARRAVAERADAILDAMQYYIDQDQSDHDDYDNRPVGNPDAVHPLRNGRLADYMGEYYEDHLVERLGDVVLSTGEEASLYHAYHPNTFADHAVYELGDLYLIPHWVSKPYELGLYVVTDEQVYTVEDAHTYGLVATNDIRYMLPGEMLYEVPYV